VVDICYTTEMKMWKIFQETGKYRDRLFSKLIVQKFSEVHSTVLQCCTVLKLRIIFLILHINLYFPSD